MRSIGHSLPMSQFAGRYVLGDSDKFLCGSTTSINRKRLSKAIFVKANNRLHRQHKEGVPLLKPITCGCDGHAWGDMAILCADWQTMDTCADALHQRRLPFNVRKRAGDYNPSADAIQIMTMKVSKGLVFPVVALPCVGHMPAADEGELEAARVFYVAATRATQKLIVTASGDSVFGKKLSLETTSNEL